MARVCITAPRKEAPGRSSTLAPPRTNPRTRPSGPLVQYRTGDATRCTQQTRANTCRGALFLARHPRPVPAVPLCALPRNPPRKICRVPRLQCPRFAATSFCSRPEQERSKKPEPSVSAGGSGSTGRKHMRGREEDEREEHARKSAGGHRQRVCTEDIQRCELHASARARIARAYDAHKSA